MNQFFIACSLWALIGVEEVMKDNTEVLLESVIQGRLDTFRTMGRTSPLPNAVWEETELKGICSSGVEYACSNGIIEKDEKRVLSDVEIDEAIHFFSMKNLPFIWWTADKNLENKGFQYGGILTGIALDMSQGLPRLPSSPATIEIIHSDKDLKIATDLVTNAFGLNQKIGEQNFIASRASAKAGEQIFFLARIDGVPVGTAMLSVSPSSAGIWALATVPEYRQRGVGTALIHAALVEAKKRHYNQVMAILMPKGMAWGPFTKLGFKEVCQFPFYVYGASPEELE